MLGSQPSPDSSRELPPCWGAGTVGGGSLLLAGCSGQEGGARAWLFRSPGPAGVRGRGSCGQSLSCPLSWWPSCPRLSGLVTQSILIFSRSLPARLPTLGCLVLK